MNRLARYLSTFTCILSLLLCAFTVILWFRSYKFTELVTWQNNRGWREIRTATGKLVLGLLITDWHADPQDSRPRYQRDEARPPFNSLIYLSPEVNDIDFAWERSGFAWYEKRNPRNGTVIVISVAPFWA